MNELDELLAALEAAYRNNDVNAQALLNSYIMPAYRKYKAATPPLVLEAVECTESVILFDYWEEDESVQYNGQCYKLPEG